MTNLASMLPITSITSHPLTLTSESLNHFNISIGLNKFRKSKILKYSILNKGILSLSKKSTGFYYNDLSPICIGDEVKLPNSTLIGRVSQFKGALCVIFDQGDIKPVLFYDVYIHENNIIKAFQKID